MGILASQFRSLVILPALKALELAGIPYTQTAADLLMATAANETHLGTWIAQVDGPALGVFEQEPSSWGDVALKLTPAQRSALTALALPIAPDMTILDQLPGNMLLAAGICRLFYWYATNEPLPPDTKSGLWEYYKRFYNSLAGAATEAQFMANLAAYSDLQGLPA